MTKRFFYAALGILCLSAAYQIGASRAAADSGVVKYQVAAVAEAKSGTAFVISDNGDFFVISAAGFLVSHGNVNEIAGAQSR